MNLCFRQILTLIAALLLAINVPAQDIPVLPKDPAISDGILPNGMAYYLVSNPAEKGTADFALVQKIGKLTVSDMEREQVANQAGVALDSLKRMRPSSPVDFLIRHGAARSEGGFVKITDDATVFRFSGINLLTAPIDSLLLLVMDIADRPGDTDDAFLRKWYSPADHAIIISGDINPPVIAAKLLSMSYMIPSRESAARPEYIGNAVGEGLVITPSEGNPSLSQVSATWTSERAAREYMNTIQTEILEMSMNTLGFAAVNRLRRMLRAADVPAADVSYSHKCSATYPYDDAVTITALVNSADTSRVSGAMLEIMSSIEKYGLGIHEYRVAESIYNQELMDAASRPFTSNSDYVDRCMNAYLYNAPLASAKERLSFHTSRNLPDTMRQRLFNDIAKALIDTTMVSSAAIPYEDMTVPDSLDCSVTPLRMKLKSSRREPVSGGSIWTFSNGFRVIYKNMPSDRLYYGLALNGGYGSVSGLEAGEGAFLSDYLRTCRISGMSAEDFLNVLRVNGVTMDCKVNMSNTMISGSLPKDRMALLLHAILAVANSRDSDEEAFSYYKKSEYLALDHAEGSLYARMTAVDSIICPGYKYSSYKVKGRMSKDFPAKAEAFYESQFAKMNDGALILVGNLDEEKLKKELLAHVGGFRTSGSVSRKLAVNYQAVSGTSTYTVNGRTDNVDLVISSRLPVTMDNYAAAELAAMVLEHKLSEEFDGSGIRMSLTHECWIYPEERLNMLISLSSDSEGAIGILADVRSALSSLRDVEISDAGLNVMKAVLKNRAALEMQSPSYWVDAIMLRYLIGKDLSTAYAAKIDALTPAKVKSVLSLLDEGCKVEYVTIKK